MLSHSGSIKLSPLTTRLITIHDQHPKIMSRSRILLLFFASTFTKVGASDQCYFPNGSVQNNTYVCNPSAKFSPCCTTGDVCTNLGLCVNDLIKTNDSLYWRNSCTDPTWKSSECAQVCQTTATGMRTVHRVYDHCHVDDQLTCDPRPERRENILEDLSMR